MLESILDSLHDSAVRDLAWVIGSPGLLDASHPAYAGRMVDDAWCGAQLQACAPWLAALDLDPCSLHDYVAARPTRRLGLYFEALIAFWLAHMSNTQLIATNLQVRDAGRTVGDYDFLFRDAGNHVCHWEAAVKFYLQAEPLAEQRAFIGPGARDRLDLKVDRVFTRQLELGNMTAGRAALPSGMTVNRAQAFIKGYLFYPAQITHSAGPIPGISGKHLSGWWVRHQVACLPQTTPDTAWMILPRLRWLAPVRLDSDADVMQHGEMCAALDRHFATSSEALLLAEVRRDVKGVWREVSRGFVVHSNWPGPDTPLQHPLAAL